MEIQQRFKFVEGNFDTLTNKMLCIASDKHGTVELCFKLYDSGLYKDFAATMPDAKKLGEEIARRWNECRDKK